MVDLQKNFITFHDKIKLEYEDNSLLRDYKDQVLDGLKKNLDIDHQFSPFVQGSYSVFTGIKSSDVDIDFDIDIGIELDINRNDYEDPVKLKVFVRDAMKLTFPQSKVEIKKPCVTINFSDKNSGESVHVDIALYAKENGSYYLARGNEYGNYENRYWEEAEPKKLKDKINNFSEDPDARKQFRRCIRYLKRWKDNKFNQENRPTGIGITSLALQNFKSKKSVDLFAGSTTYNDLQALKEFVSILTKSFTCPAYDEKNGTNYMRIEADLPVSPHSDTFCKMTAKQMKDFKIKLDSLYEDLNYAGDTFDKHEATKLLNKQFGNDFEIVSEQNVSEQSRNNGFITDYPSA
ncbi:cyclic GMP-AMP synthase DncV-like nucleotidyltransferase [Tetragenococcus halophilus]|uniref:cyclic GMP-AMP synthase DncV-like nucleotidyltransferase n=1 Tax=Tetragenococcus halophilus TaxID=51669 RepID=UPI000B929F56|nr:hypothetical protein [Tetragenococcus halophilus]MCF1600634.1 hypothetical protein [Tetragenococcus halophilus]